MKRRVEVNYTGPPSEELDKQLTKILKAIGCKWYAQGYDLVHKVRDIAFDLEEVGTRA